MRRVIGRIGPSRASGRTSGLEFTTSIIIPQSLAPGDPLLVYNLRLDPIGDPRTKAQVWPGTIAVPHEHGSIRVGADDFTAAPRPQCVPSGQADGRFDESDRAIQDQHVRTARMGRAGSDEGVDVAETPH